MASPVVDYWDEEKMLDVHIYDYLVRRNLHASAEMFAQDAIHVRDNLAVVNQPYGFLSEWWEVFWDIYSSRELAYPQAMENSTVKGIGQNSPSMPFPELNSSSPVLNQQQQLHTSVDHHLLPLNDISGTEGQAMVPGRLTAEQEVSVLVEQTAEQKQAVPVDEYAEEQQKDRQKQQKVPEDGKGTEVEKPSDVDMEPLVSHDVNNAGNTSTSFSDFQTSTTRCSIKNQNGLQFEEVASVNSSNGKILCCHFSTDGRFVASAGYDRKVSLWRTSTSDFVDTVEGHSQPITDVRFRPNSSTFATSSFDKTVQLWDAKKPTKLLSKFFGHTGQVTSLDFNPSMTDVFCSCDSNDEIRLWSIKQCSCTCLIKGDASQVRFQPRLGKLLATASGNRISLFDVETNILQCSLMGHVKEVRSICWDSSGRYIASVSEESARVWAIATGTPRCIYELQSNGNKFESCTFHPVYSLLVVIGCYKSIQLWNPTDKGSTPITVSTAHQGLISALADCPKNQMIASASHDGFMKLWK